MMLFQQLKNEQLQARKDHNTEVASRLSCMISDIQRSKKTPRDEITDSDVLSEIKKTINRIEKDLPKITAIGADITTFVDEINFWKKYLPEVLSFDETKSVIESLIVELNITSKNKNSLMGVLSKKSFDKPIDMKLAKQILDSLNLV